MIKIDYATEEDRVFWFTLDRHMEHGLFAAKIRDGQCYVIREGEMPVGILRYNLFWDNTPFLTEIYLTEAARRKGFGTQAVLRWENDMKHLGCRMVMTSTMSNEEAQHFYRKLGYLDIGCLTLNALGFAEPLEIFLGKLV